MGLILVFVVHCTVDGKFSGESKPKPSSEEKQESPRYEAESPSDNDTSTNAQQSRASTDKSKTLTTEQVIARCNNKKPKTLTKVIEYPPREGCNWGIGENNKKNNGYLSAMEIQTSTIQLPKDSIICNISLASREEFIQYDDHIALVMDDFQLMVSFDNSKYYDTNDRLLKWDWLKVRNTRTDDDTIYCAGQCTLPKTQQKGIVSIKMNSKNIAELATAIQAKKSVEMQMISIGDNDDKDCSHSGLTLDVEVEYVRL